MYEIMSADEAIRLIRDGDCICVNSFVGIENPVELHEALYRRYQKMQSPNHLTMVSSAGFGVWDENRNAEGYIREGAVDRLICGHFGAMPSTRKIVLEDRFEAYNLPLGCISHAIRAQAGGLPGALSKVGLDIFVDPRQEGPGINRLSIDDSLVKYVEVDGEEFLYYKLPPLTVALIKGTAADRKGNISFDDQFMSGDALSICQAVKANNGKVIVQVDRLVDTPTRPRNTIIPGCLVDAVVVAEPEERKEAYVALTGSFEISYSEWMDWNEKIDSASTLRSRNSVAGNIIGRRAARELRVDDIVNIGIGIPEMVSRHARKNGMLDMITLTVESGGIGGFPVSGEAFGAAVSGAVSALISIGGYVVFFSALLGVTEALGFPGSLSRTLAGIFGGQEAFFRALLTGILELSSGIGAMRGLPLSPGSLALASLLMGWGGLCVHLQAAAVVRDAGLRLTGRLPGKLLHGILSAAVTYFLAQRLL